MSTCTSVGLCVCVCVSRRRSITIHDGIARTSLVNLCDELLDDLDTKRNGRVGRVTTDGRDRQPRREMSANHTMHLDDRRGLARARYRARLIKISRDLERGACAWRRGEKQRNRNERKENRWSLRMAQCSSGFLGFAGLAPGIAETPLTLKLTRNINLSIGESLGRSLESHTLSLPLS